MALVGTAIATTSSNTNLKHEQHGRDLGPRLGAGHDQRQRPSESTALIACHGIVIDR